ncbi:MAG: hypothetical protein A3H93_19605 [Rhodocyclales bacterium RIFCSPLOWO2_02_FULL_63_24]|nr:MAG: hypothetical protein A3H93_19605 [Rhodocyclales bacterium RIFCSPLOWO2_02_FULL_63_24]
MSIDCSKVVLILDDREFPSGEVRSLIGARRFGDIILKRRSLVDRFRDSLPDWARDGWVHLRTEDDLRSLRVRLEESPEDCAIFVVAASAGFGEIDQLRQLLERLPFAEEDFTDRMYRPLIVFLRNAHRLVGEWPAFRAAPFHCWERGWQDCRRLQSLRPLDLDDIRDFLTFACGATSPRHFNNAHIDDFFFTKRSKDKHKMLQEYSYYGLVPERMRPWLVESFDYADEGDTASYKMLRYYLADAGLQWVHGAFDADTFAVFVDRLLHFVVQRPRQESHEQKVAEMARDLFVDKLKRRASEFLALEEGVRIDALAASSTPELALACQMDRFLRLYARHGASFAGNHLVVGHGDPCFSNILYDQRRYLLKLVDPRGAISANELWTHPLYDLCKISHSILGDYDFINGGLYRVGFADSNELVLHLDYANQGELKLIFRQRLARLGYDINAVRLGEASLFLSMLPLHIDFPNKVLAFMLQARRILDEVESGRN